MKARVATAERGARILQLCDARDAKVTVELDREQDEALAELPLDIREELEDVVEALDPLMLLDADGARGFALLVRKAHASTEELPLPAIDAFPVDEAFIRLVLRGDAVECVRLPSAPAN